MIVEVLDEPLKNMKDIPKQELLKRLKERGISIITNSRAIRIEKGKVIIEDKNGVKKELVANSVIFAVGNVPANSLYNSFKGLFEEIYLIGDAKVPGNLGAALRSATEVVLKI
jgi:pyruvate/2-oxoglutarate dehydrogenase complex dihydrolipoamide dehydrogenase (E3) component